MKLRKTVRLPQRLDSDLFYQPLSLRPLRGNSANRDDTAPRYIDYNPNLPPAAFPTLDRPHTPEHHCHSRLSDQDQRDEQDADEEVSTPAKLRRASVRRVLDSFLATSSESQKDAPVDFEDIPMDLFENYIASNTDLNPIYASNMAKMAVAERQDSSLVNGDMEDSDSGETVMGNSESSPAVTKNPTWTDLSERMQAEILENLLETYTWFTACRMLGLTKQERSTIQVLLLHRAGQIELEDLQLKAMRAKQLRELLKVDNSCSSKRNRVPHQLVFRKISLQTTRQLRAAMERDTDFLCCEGSELTAARSFLSKRGIEAKFAGDWSSNIVLVQTADEDADPDLDEDSSISFQESRTCIEIPDIDPQPNSPPTVAKEAFMNWFGSTTSESNCPNPPSKWLTLLFKDCLEPESSRRRKKTREEQYNTQYHEGYSVKPDNMYRQIPPMDYFFSEELALELPKRLKDLNNTPQRTRDPGQRQRQTNCRIPFSVSEPPSREPLASPFDPSEDRLDEACRYAKLPTSHLESGPDEAAILHKGLMKTPVFIRVPVSRSTTPEGPGSRTDSERGLFAFSNIGSPRTVATQISPPASASLGETDSAEPEDFLAIVPGASDCRSWHSLGVCDVGSASEHTCDSSHIADEDEEDEVEENEDEMVLLPTASEPS